MIDIIIGLINFLAQALILLIIVSAALSFFMSPYHPVRRGIDQIVGPLLAPIRRIVPLVGMIDFSPLILIILVEIVSYVVKSLLYMVR